MHVEEEKKGQLSAKQIRSMMSRKQPWLDKGPRCSEMEE